MKATVAGRSTARPALIAPLRAPSRPRQVVSRRSRPAHTPAKTCNPSNEIQSRTVGDLIDLPPRCINVECRSSSLIAHTRSTAEHTPHTGGGCCVAAGHRAVGGLFEAPSARLSGAAPCQSSDSAHLEHILQRALRVGRHGGQPGCGVVRDTSCLGARGSGACARCFRVSARFSFG